MQRLTCFHAFDSVISALREDGQTQEVSTWLLDHTEEKTKDIKKGKDDQEREQNLKPREA